MWNNPKSNPPPEYEEVIIKVTLTNDNCLMGLKGDPFAVERRAVYMQGYYYSTDFSHCITHKIDGWREIK